MTKTRKQPPKIHSPRCVLHIVHDTYENETLKYLVAIITFKLSLNARTSVSVQYKIRVG